MKAPPPGFKIIQGGAPPPPPPSEENAPEKNYRQSDAGEVARGAMENLGPSAGKFVYDTAQAVAHPIDTVETLANVGSGAINLIPGVDSVMKFGQDAGLLHKPDAAELAKVEQQKEMARGLGRIYADKYGSMEGFKQAVATDPVGVLGDLASVFTGGGAVAKISTASKVGRALNPVNIVKKASKPVTFAAREGTGLTTGAGGAAVKEAFEAGKEGGKRSRDLSSNMKGLNQDAVIDEAKAAVAKMRDERHAKYRDKMVDTKTFNQPVDIRPVIDDYMKLHDKLFYKGNTKITALDKAQQDKLDEIGQLILEWHKEGAVTPAGLDLLKQRIHNLRSAGAEQPVVDMIIGEMGNSVKNVIVKQVPSYAKAMKEYETASNAIDEVTRTLSLGQKGSKDTALRKLQSALRNNVNTNYNARTKLVEGLEDYGAENMKTKLAGQALSSRTPRGIQGAVGGSLTSGGIVAALAGLLEPTTAAAVGVGALTASPRFVGRAAQIAGKGARLADSNAILAARDAGSVAQLAQPPAQEEPVAEASVPQPPQPPPGITREQALADAQKALDAGADPIKVKERLGEILKTLRTQ